MNILKIKFDKIDKPHWVIKSKKQKNGLWGMPFNCNSISRMVVLSDENQKKQSAILISIAEKFPNRTFCIQFASETGFVIYYNDGKSPSFNQFNYADYELIKNILIFNK